MGPAWAQRPLKGFLWLHVFWVLLSSVCCSHDPPEWRFTSSEVVIPRKIPHRRGEIEMPNQLAYSIRFRGQRHVIHMKLKKNLMARHLPIITNNDQGAMQEDYPYIPQDCYYYSHLQGVPGSMATLDTCHGGLRGMLQVDDFTYEIKPLKSSSKFEHVVSLLVLENRADEDNRCKIEEEQLDQVLEEVNLAESPRASTVYQWRLHMKYLKMHYTITKSIYEQNPNQSLVIDKVVSINNILDSIFKPVNLNVYIRILCIWQTADQFNLQRWTSVSEATHSFGVWKYHGLWKFFSHDMSIIYAGFRIGNARYYASHAGLCNGNWGAGFVHIPNYHMFMAATLTAHTLGHSMSVFHDGPECVCFRRHTCLMNRVPGLLDTFSNCSYDSLHHNIHRWDPCLSGTSRPYYNFPYDANRCGDKYITLNEKCDCGSLKECAEDPCCGTNCDFTSGSVCDKGLCCEHCKFARAGKRCRAALGICDLPEYCNGSAENCPNDVYVQDGTPCSPMAVCAKGNCSDREMQCQSLFGLEVKDGSPVCYEKLNVVGDRFGNCGLRTVRGGSRPMKCEPDDIFCGMLHCTNVQQIPGGGEHSTIHHILVGETKVESCFGFDTHHGEELPEFGLVVDGSSCGAAQYCFEKNCTFHQDMPYDCDVKTCSFRGVCNNLKHCHCLQGWGPPNCEQKGQGGSIDSGPPPGSEGHEGGRLIITINKAVALILTRTLSFLLTIFIGSACKAKQVVAERKAKPKA